VIKQTVRVRTVKSRMGCDFVIVVAMGITSAGDVATISPRPTTAVCDLITYEWIIACV
jgi:hypothetical protein